MKAKAAVAIGKGTVWYAIAVSSTFVAIAALGYALATKAQYWWWFLFGAGIVAAIGFWYAGSAFDFAERTDTAEVAPPLGP